MLATKIAWLGLVLSTSLALPGEDEANDRDWPQWRGPAFNGSGTCEGLPATWDLAQDVAWATELAGPSAATPIVSGDHVFLAALEPESETLIAMAVARDSGEILWEIACGTGQTPSPRSRGRENTFAAGSPVTDGKVVCFLFGNGNLVAFDFDGEELWRTNVAEKYGPIRIGWGYAASPLLFEGRLIVSLLQSAKSFVLAFDPQTGETLWERERSHEARAESQEAYTTPIPFHNEAAQRWEILVLGADCLTSHDPATGEEYWRWSDLNPRNAPNFRAVSSPVVGDDGMIFVTSPQHNPMHGLRIGEGGVEKVWEHRSPTPDSTTPLYYRGRLYALNGRKGAMVCLEPATGRVLWTTDLETSTFSRASPTGADGKIYSMDAEGEVVVLAAGDEYEELGRMRFDSYPSRSTIVPNRGQLLIRTADKLYCIGAAAR